MKISVLHREDKEYSESVRTSKTSTLVTEKMMIFFSMLHQEGDAEITQEKIRR